MGLYESAKKYVGWPITPGNLNSSFISLHFFSSTIQSDAAREREWEWKRESSNKKEGTIVLIYFQVLNFLVKSWLLVTMNKNV